MGEFTPGPWKFGQCRAQRKDGRQWSIGLAPDPTDSADVTGCSPHLGNDDYMLLSGICREADARLIAAAPDLLEALEAMRVVMDRGDKPAKLDAALSWRECDEKARSMCDAALAKARGEP